MLRTNQHFLSTIDERTMVLAEPYRIDEAK